MLCALMANPGSDNKKEHDFAEEAGPATPVIVEVPDGQRIDIGDYDLIDTIGSGGMGVVYKAKHKKLDKTMAIKCLHRELAVDAANVRRFAQEVCAASQLSHANLVSVYDSGITDDGTPYLVMDYLEGTSLADTLRKEGFLPLERFIEIFLQVTEALDHAHAKGIVHRDLKPSNIMLVGNESSVSDFVKIVDFGIARVIQEVAKDGPQVTQTGDVIGSPVYMSPEQCLGKNLDRSSDIYSLGVVMYECLTGKAPFAADNAIQMIVKHVQDKPIAPSKLRPDLRIPPELDNLILSCLEKDPALRPKNLHDIRIELLLLRGEIYSGRKRSLPLGERVRRTTKRAVDNFSVGRDAAVILSVIGLIVLCASVFWYRFSINNPSQTTPEKQVAELMEDAKLSTLRQNPQQANHEYKEALAIAEKHNLPARTQVELNSQLGEYSHELRIHDGLSDAERKDLYRESIKYHKRVLELLAEHTELGPPPAAILDHLSFESGQVGSYGDGEEFGRQAVKLHKDELQSHAPQASVMGTMQAYQYLAEHLDYTNHRDEAIELLEESIALAKQWSGAQFSQEAYGNLLTLRDLYRHKGDYKKAVEVDKELMGVATDNPAQAAQDLKDDQSRAGAQR